ncbi:MAG: ABC transporter permease [candidate division Zixibacteria bacterium]
MIRNYVVASVRSLLKNKAYTLISVIGLSLGLGMGMFSLAYLLREMSFDQFHENKDQIYRVEMDYHHADTAWSSALVMAPLADELEREVSAIDEVALFRHRSRVPLKVDQTTYAAGHMILAGPEFFDLFSFPLRVGDPTTALLNPNSVLITDTIARMYFADKNPIGQRITLDKTDEYTITGILENFPSNTQMRCDFVASYSTLRSTGADLDSWTDNRSDFTYLLLKEDADPDAVEVQIGAIFSRNVSDEMSQRYNFRLKPFNDIYYQTYYSRNRGELNPGWELDMIIFLVGIGLFILIQSIVNFVSLSTARGAERMKEVGIRKTLGASRSRLIGQFLSESLILTAVAMIVSQFFFELLKNGYNSIAPTAYEKTYELANLYADPGSIMLLALMTVIVGIISGFYPAIYLSKFKPISMFQSASSGVPTKSTLRKVLVVFQFTLAIFFITVTAGFYHQQAFITTYDLGFDRSDMMVLRFQDPELTADDCALAKREILARNDVLGAARTSTVLGGRHWSTVLFTSPERTEEDRALAKYFEVDYDFLTFYNIELLDGKGFSPDRPEEIGRAILINESFRDDLELSSPVGHTLFTDSGTVEIIGVVKDFQGTALDWSYRASAVIALDPEVTRVLAVKLKPDDISGSTAAIGKTWQRTFGDSEFEYTFLEDDIRAQYREMDALIPMFAGLSLISIIIACLGILGLVSYTVERKTKEIAIRKVLGASVMTIFKGITKGFALLIIISNAIAVPFAYFLITMSIEESPFQASIGIDTYVLGGLLTLTIALLASAYHVTRAARANPSDALRCE